MSQIAFSFVDKARIIVKAGFHLEKLSSGQKRTGMFPFCQSHSFLPRAHKTKETFLSVPVPCGNQLCSDGQQMHVGKFGSVPVSSVSKARNASMSSSISSLSFTIKSINSKKFSTPSPKMHESITFKMST